jgi:hypothetical protein
MRISIHLILTLLPLVFSDEVGGCMNSNLYYVVQLLKSIASNFSKQQGSSFRGLQKKEDFITEEVNEKKTYSLKDIPIAPIELWSCLQKKTQDGETATPHSGCSCGSRIVDPVPGQALLLMPGEYISEYYCNLHCGREPDDTCSFCSMTQILVGGGQVQTKYECKHRSEVEFFSGTLFQNNMCHKKCIPKLPAQVELLQIAYPP